MRRPLTLTASLLLCPPLHASHPRLFYPSNPLDSRPTAEAGRASTMAALSELAGSAGAAPPAQPVAGQWSAWQGVHSAASGGAPAAPAAAEETDPIAELAPPELAAGGGIAAAPPSAGQQVPGVARSLSDSLSSQPRPGSGLGGSGMLFGPGSCFSTGSSSVHSGGLLVAPGAAEAYAAQTPPPAAAAPAGGAPAAVESTAAAAIDMEETEAEGTGAGAESPSMAEVPILHEEGSGEWGGSGEAAGPTVGDGSLPAAAADGSEGMDSSEEWEVVQEAGEGEEEEEGAGGGEEEAEERGMPAPA